MCESVIRKIQNFCHPGKIQNEIIRGLFDLPSSILFQIFSIVRETQRDDSLKQFTALYAYCETRDHDLAERFLQRTANGQIAVLNSANRM